MTVCAAFWVAVVKIVYRAPPFAIDSTIELWLRCFFSVGFLGSDMLRVVLPVASFTPSLQQIGVRSMVANSKS